VAGKERRGGIEGARRKGRPGKGRAKHGRTEGGCDALDVLQGEQDVSKSRAVEGGEEGIQGEDVGDGRGGGSKGRKKIRTHEGNPHIGKVRPRIARRAIPDGNGSTYLSALDQHNSRRKSTERKTHPKFVDEFRQRPRRRVLSSAANARSRCYPPLHVSSPSLLLRRKKRKKTHPFSAIITANTPPPAAFHPAP
jgi:hypothetical protein